MWTRLFTDVLFYTGALCLLAYFAMDDRMDLLYIGGSCLGISFLIFLFFGRNQQIRDNYASNRWDSLWSIIDVLEIPFRIIVWLFGIIWKIFD